MPSISDMTPKGVASIWKAINALRKRLDQLAGAQGLQNASIIGGQLVITDNGRLAVIASNGEPIFLIGQIGAAGGGGFQEGMIVSRLEDGSDVLFTYNYGGASQTLNWMDDNGNIVVADDRAGLGLGKPYLGCGGWYDATTQGKTPLSTATSSSWTTIQSQPWYVQHPNITCLVLGQAAASTAGLLRIVDANGVQIGSTASFSNGGFGVAVLGGALTTPQIGALTSLSLQAQRTSGTGTIGGAGLSTWGLGSA